MTKTSEEALIAILIEKLGGEVIITHEDFRRADELEVTRWDRPATMDYKLTATPAPVTLDGEIVPDEPKRTLILCEAPEECACVCHKLGYVSHGDCCGADS